MTNNITGQDNAISDVLKVKQRPARRMLWAGAALVLLLLAAGVYSLLMNGDTATIHYETAEV